MSQVFKYKMENRCDITLTLRCNNNCIFCPRSILSHITVRDELDIRERLIRLKAVSKRVVLIGGEVTVLENLFEIISLCKQIGFTHIAVVSNGRKFSDERFAEKVVSSGVTEVCVTIYDARKDVHERITRKKNSFDETINGIKNIVKIAAKNPGLTARVNTVLCKDNHDGMVELVSMVAGMGITGVLIADVILSNSYPEPVGYERVREIVREILNARLNEKCDIVMRGFPLCIFNNMEGVSIETTRECDRFSHGYIRTEIQDIDTTFSSQDDIQGYFNEFYSNFVRVDACWSCAVKGRCPGVQKLYIGKFGSRLFHPVKERSLPDEDRFVKKLMDFMEARSGVARIAVTPTTACQLRCSYCMVELGRGNCPVSILKKAGELLMTSSSTDVELQFFGGEPLIEWEKVKRTIIYCQRLADKRGKRILFTLTTNGILLDRKKIDFLKNFNSKIIFSIDGDYDTQLRCRYIGLRNPRRVHQKILRALRCVIDSGINYSVNMVVTPETVEFMRGNVEYLVSVGVKTIQICYGVGLDWSEEKAAAFCKAMSFAVKQSKEGGKFRLQNIGSGVEPSILSNDIIVDIDGMIYGDGALFSEKYLVNLRSAYKVGHIEEIKHFDGLRKTKSENMHTLLNFYRGSPIRQSIIKHLRLGYEVEKLLRTFPKRDNSSSRLSRFSSASIPSMSKDYPDRNPIAEKVLSKDLETQRRFISVRADVLKFPILLLANRCGANCIFCKGKELEPTPFEDVKRWLEGNKKYGFRKLGLGGNEPLMHPHIIKILDEALRCGFEEFEVLTTGFALKHEDFIETILKRGVRTFSIPLFSLNAENNDFIMGKRKSYTTTIKAIETLKGMEARVFIHSNLIRQNMEELPELERFVSETLDLPFCIVPVRAKSSNLPYESLAVSYTDMIEKLRGKVSCLVGFPVCVAGKIQQPAVCSAEKISDILKVYILDQNYYKPPLCKGCKMWSRCTGSFKLHIDIFGAKELKRF